MMKDNIYVTKALMPSFEEYIEAIKPLWDSHLITNMGDYHCRLEEELKTYLDVKEVSLMVNGHMSLEMAIQAMNFPYGSEVITTPFTFISTTHAIVRNGLVPVFCDVKESDGTIDENLIESLITEKTVAIVPVHVYGHICNVEKIKAIAQKYNLKVIYDAAHAFGETYKGIGVGNFGDCSIFSFHATKVFNTIEGGAVTGDSRDLYEKLYNLKNFGIRNEELVTDVGANAKMNEFSSIMGLCNLKLVDNEIQLRKERFQYYMCKLKGIGGIDFYQRNDAVTYNYGYLPIRVIEKEYGISRNRLYDVLRTYHIWARKYFYPLTCDQQCYCKLEKGSIEAAERLSAETLVLPLYGDLAYEVIDRICEVIKEKK